MFNRSCSVDFFVPHFWAAFLTLNPLSRTSFTALVKVVDRLPFCVLQLLRKGLYKIRRFPSVSAYALRAVCCKNRLRVCKIEKSDFLKICQNKGFSEVVLKI